MSEDPHGARAFEDVAVALREATRRLRGLQVDEENRTRLTGKLLAIANSSKHDLGVAATRLRAFLAELDHLGGGSTDQENNETQRKFRPGH